MTLEEKNVLNLTRQNTTFNTHAQNLNGSAEPAPLLRLGVDKKVTPLITVRPFGMRNSEKAINKVQPMINGEVVLNKNNKEDISNSGRGESRQNCVLNSDGASSETSSDSAAASDDQEDSDQGSGNNNNNIENHQNDNKNANVRPSSVIESQFFSKAKQTAATARLSFLNSTITFEKAKDEPTTIVESNWVKTPEDEDEIDEAAQVNKKKNVKLIRKSPYVVGRAASTTILKGTPKPSINVRNKPPSGKPPVPAKPEKLQIGGSSSSSAGSCSTSSSGSVSPIAAPRRPENSIKKSGSVLIQSRIINDFVQESEVTISADESTRIELSSNSNSIPNSNSDANSNSNSNSSVCSDDSEESGFEGTTSFAECYTVNADMKNAIILDVSCTSGTTEEPTFTTELEVLKQLPLEKEETKHVSIPEAPKLLPKVQQNFQQMALDAIRKSLANKISVQEELTDKDDEDVEKIICSKPPLVKTSSNTSSNFEANRASVANALMGFSRKPSTKSKAAPKPPALTCPGGPTLEAEAPAPETPVETIQCSPAVPAGVIPEAPPPPPEPLTPTIQVTTNPTPLAASTPVSVAGATNSGSVAPELVNKPSIKSSIKQESSPSSSNKNRESTVVKSVQFSPETSTMTLPSSPPSLEPDLQPISYNRWISRDPHGSPAIVESSFTGQPIAVQPPRQQHKEFHLKQKPVTVQNANQTTDTDEIRKWTEKKKGSR